MTLPLNLLLLKGSSRVSKDNGGYDKDATIKQGYDRTLLRTNTVSKEIFNVSRH
jgi:hypothetical protein